MGLYDAFSDVNVELIRIYLRMYSVLTRKFIISFEMERHLYRRIVPPGCQSISHSSSLCVYIFVTMYYFGNKHCLNHLIPTACKDMHSAINWNETLVAFSAFVRARFCSHRLFWENCLLWISYFPVHKLWRAFIWRNNPWTQLVNWGRSDWMFTTKWRQQSKSFGANTQVTYYLC